MREKSEASDERCFEKMALFAGGIAHNLNNILTGIYGALSLLESSLTNPQAAERYLVSLHKSADKARDLAAQLILLARNDVPALQALALDRYLRSAVAELCKGTPNLFLGFSIESGLPEVHVDISQFSEVVKHLVQNALQAMPDGGRLEVKASRIVAPTEIWGKEIFSKSESWIEITVKDSGKGIPPEFLTVVFEPHISTKTHGVGLGLPVCKAVLRRHGGFIHLESEYGRSTIVRILLPIKR